MARRASAGDAAQAVALGELIARVSDQPVESKEVLDALGVTDGPAEAQRLWNDAAAKGNAQAMFDLGWQADAGWGVSADPNVARSWWKQAAVAGNARAMYRYGLLLRDSGNQVDEDNARFWLALAARFKAVGAQMAADRATFGMSGDKRDLLDSRVAGWKVGDNVD
jgi:TPR repeat protein